MKLQVRGILFDMDGILVSSLGSVERSWAKWGEMRNVDAALAIKTAHGQRAIETVRKLRPDLNDIEELKLIEEIEIADNDDIEVLAGVPRILAALPQKYWTIVTSATEKLARARLSYAGLTVPEHFITADMVRNGKPDPEPYLKGAALLGLDPKDCLVIEDSSAGAQPAQVLAIVRGWHHGRTPSVRSPRARERLTEVQPLLIAALADTVDPDGAIASFDRFLSELPSGVQLFSLLAAQPALIRLIADIMGSAPRLAHILSKRRRLLDAVLDPQVLGSAFNGAAIDELLTKAFATARIGSQGDSGQEILDTARRIGSEQTFLVGVRVLTGSISATEAGVAYATIADRLIAGLLTEVTRQMEEDHGRVQGGSAVVVAMGKLGGREMTAASDVDLIVIYNFDTTAEQSDGKRPLAPPHYYTRLTQRLINAISARTAEGALYDVDMRLRPSGQQGPVATRYSSFASYQASEAWTWEHMALTRARVIAGSRELAANVEMDIRKVLGTRRDRAKIAADVRDMRKRIEAEKATSDIWNLKQVRGGLIDLEFIVQYLQLAYAADHPALLHQTTLVSLAAAASEGVISPEDYRRLASAGQLLHDLTQILRLTLEGPFNPASAPKGLKSRLVRASHAESFEDLEGKLKQTFADVSAAFEKLII